MAKFRKEIHAETAFTFDLTITTYFKGNTYTEIVPYSRTVECE